MGDHLPVACLTSATFFWWPLPDYGKFSLVCSHSQTVCPPPAPQGLSNLSTGGLGFRFRPQIPPLVGDRSFCLIQCYLGSLLLGATRVSLPNGISFRPTALAGSLHEYDRRHTDGQIDRPRYGNMCRNSDAV